MLKYMALKLSVNTIHSTVTQALMALSDLMTLSLYSVGSNSSEGCQKSVFLGHHPYSGAPLKSTSRSICGF